MRFPVPLMLLLAVTGCADMNRGGKWPSLAPRPGEISGSAPRASTGPCAGCGQDAFEEPATPAAVALPPAPADVGARLDSVAKTIDGVEAKLPAQRKATADAIAVAAGKSADSNAATEAEVQRSRLESLYLPLNVEEHALDVIDDDLTGKAGADVLVAQAQALRARLARLQADRL